jgi:hypothetical protein
MDVTAALVTIAVSVGTLTPMTANEATMAPITAPITVASTANVEQISNVRRASLTAPKVARPTALMPLYASLAVLQGFDIFSTSKAVSRGAQEANPLMAPVAGKSMASVAVKAAATAGSVFFIERAWKQNRKGAVILATALNVATAAVVAHNTQVAKQSR